MSAGRRDGLTRCAVALLGVACIVVALLIVDAAAHEMFAQAPARSPFDIGVREGSGPPPATGFSAWVLAEQLGFVGGLEACAVWSEAITGPGGVAVNLVQPLRLGVA